MTLRTLALFSLLPLAAACGDAAAQDPIVLDSACAETDLASDGSVAAWESAGWPPAPRCDWLLFDGRRTVELNHGLGRTPRDVSIYLAFEPDGRSAAPAAGDLARILAADADSVQLRNETNEDFFLKVVLR